MPLARRWSFAFLVGCLAARLGSPLQAEVRLPAILGSNMVLQAGQPLPFWGWATPGERIQVEAGERKGETQTGVDGTWHVRLDPLAAGGPLEVIVTGRNRLVLKNVLVGEVWLCSGQSNMTFALSGESQAAEALAAAHRPSLRLFTVQRKASEEKPLEEVLGRWVECTPETARTFSAVAYYLGVQLQEGRKSPVGLIHSSWGGTKAEAWTPREALASDPALQPILDRWQQALADLPRLTAEFEANKDRLLSEWRQKAAEAAARGGAAPTEPRVRIAPNSQYAPVALYNAMIAPLAPFAIAGVAWYQGEGNAGRGLEYRTLFPAMIKSWRATWGRELPFIFVQLPNIGRLNSRWPEVREAQLLSRSVPGTEMIVTIDVGDPKDLHPRAKAEVGRRLALAAEALVYGQPGETRLSPLFQRARTEGEGGMRVSFLPGRGGLAVRPGGSLQGFQLAGSDRRFFPATARIEGDTVLVQCPQVPSPVAVRYAWEDNPASASLISSSGLPASPFRSDDWDLAGPPAPEP
ncbi:MAG: sialate O-acetylesterase [Opitutaceae bacterium]|nr:sialate O-acetylesterase [Opitutaceae bacterium]